MLAIASDVRVLLIKLADRLHNMRTLAHMKGEARGRIAQETLDIYAPLAGRIGMHEMREELEDLAFAELNPQAYAVTNQRLTGLAQRNADLIAEIEAQLTRNFAERGIQANVTGRQKRPYSIWRKMERKSVGFEQLSDIFGFRVVVGSAEECYRAVGVVHTTWPFVPAASRTTSRPRNRTATARCEAYLRPFLHLNRLVAKPIKRDTLRYCAQRVAQRLLSAREPLAQQIPVPTPETWVPVHYTAFSRSSARTTLSRTASKSGTSPKIIVAIAS